MQLRLSVLDEPIHLTEADLCDLDCSSVVKGWFLEMFARQPDTLYFILEVFGGKETVEDYPLAAQQLAQAMNGARPSGYVTLGDLKGAGSSTLGALRRAILGSKGGNINLAAMRCGSDIHNALASWGRGRGVVPNLGLVPLKKKVMTKVKDDDQLGLFVEIIPDRMIDFYDSLIQRYQGIFYAPGMAPDNHLDRLGGLVAYTDEVLATSPNWLTATSTIKGRLKELIGLLFPFFGDCIIRLGYGLNDGQSNLASVFALLALAQTALYFQERWLYLPEIRAMNHQRGRGGGRIDLAEEITLDGELPSWRQRVTLEQLFEERWPSVTDALISASQACNVKFGCVSSRFGDWKVVTGDVNIPIDGDLAKWQRRMSSANLPIERHQRQIWGYLTDASLDYLLATGRLGKNQPAQFEKGRLIYLLPDRKPFVVPIDFPVLVQEEFQQQLVERWRQAKNNAQRRELTNLAAGLALSVFRQRERKVGIRRMPLVAPTFNDLVASRKQFLDPHRIFEYQGQSGGASVFVLDAQRLIDLVKEGKIQTHQEFNELEGGCLHCPSPRHPDDSDYSFRVSWKEGRFACSGCGIQGIVVS